MAYGIENGRKTVTTAGTAEALESNDHIVAYVVITAETNNTGVITVGDSSVVAAVATRTGMPLSAGDSLTLHNIDLNNIFIDTTVNGDGVTYLYAS